MVQHDADRVIEHVVSVVNISASPVFTLMKDNSSHRTFYLHMEQKIPLFFSLVVIGMLLTLYF